MAVQLDDVARSLIDGKNLATVATINPDGQPQSTVVFVMRDGNSVVFSTVRGRRKTRNMQREPRISLLVLDTTTMTGYVEMRGRVEIIEDPQKVLLEKMYGKYMDVPPPPEPTAERLIIRLTPDTLYRWPPG